MKKTTATNTTTLLLVPHTHWDREWYQTFQQFRLRLVRAVDLVLDTLERDPAFTCFMLDGQTVLLDDYLEVRPEHAERLRTLARSGRLLTGPWYVQPDEFLVGGESLIRNLQVGRRMAAPYGGAMPVGYLPDSFGHIAQLPQILRGFGLDNAVLWRGVGPEIKANEFRWAAADGSEVLVIWLGDEFGYSNAANLPLDGQALAVRAQQVAERLRPRTAGSYLLLMNGSDHLEPQVGLPAALAAANEHLRESGMELRIGSLPDFIATLRETLPAGTALHSGELRSGYYAHLLPGVLSTRMWLKQRNAACEAQLVRWTEPAVAYAWALGEAHPTCLVELAWKYLLPNHAHDSICGCGIDQVHREMLPRFDQSEQIAIELTSEALHSIAAHVETRGPAHAVPLVVFNPGPGPRTEVVRCEAQLTAAHSELVDADGHVLPHEVLASSSQEIFASELDRMLVPALLGIVSEGRAMGYTISNVAVGNADEAGVVEVEVTVLAQGEPDIALVERAREEILALAMRDDITAFRLRARTAPVTELLVLAEDVPAYGGRVFYLRPAHRPTAGHSHEPSPVSRAPLAAHHSPVAAHVAHTVYAAHRPGLVHVGADQLENEHLRVEVDTATGALTVHDKHNGDTYRGLNRVVDGGDVGDLYTYCAPEHDRLVTLPSRPPAIETTAASPLRATLRVTRVYDLPASCDASRVARSGASVGCTITSEVTLAAASRRVDIRTTVDNTARDHRLRVLFPVPFIAETADAEGTFEVTRRPAQPPQADADGWTHWAEAPVGAHPQKRFVDAADGTRGLAVLNRGLAEYEMVSDHEGSAIALTLLRCVEWLSRDDLATRRGHAGPMLPTPEAQGVGTHVFEYALVPHTGEWHAEDALVLWEAQAFEAPLRALATDQHAGQLPSAWSFVRLSPADVALSAVKRAERGDGIIVRIYNTRDAVQTASLTLGVPFRAVEVADLDEVPLAEQITAERLHVAADTLTCALRPGEILTLLCRL